EAVMADPGGLDELRRMAAKWPFFDDLLGKVEMVCAKVDVEIARAYVDRLGGDRALFDELCAEFQATVSSLLAIRGHDHLLDDQAWLQSAIGLRNPYLGPLSLLEIWLLERKRTAAEDDPEWATVSAALGTVLNGIAQGLRNTG